MRRLVAAGLCGLVPLFSALAQDTTATTDPGPRVSPAFGIHYGSPLRLSGAVGVLIDRSRQHNDGFVMMLEQGIQGTEISAGFFQMIGSFGTGFSLRGAVIRTGDEPWKAAPHTTYVGAEFDGMVVFGVGGRAGYLRRASRSRVGAEDNVFVLGASIGF